MNNKKLYIIFVIGISFLLTAFIQRDSDKYFKITRSIDIFGRIFKEINLNYVDEVNPEEFMLAGIKGMLSSLDPYTVYLDKDLQKDIQAITKGKYGGIGATVGIQNGKITIVDLLEGYSAQRQGLRIGDIIVRVDSTDMNLDNYESLGDFLKKEPGQEVSITIEREGNENELVFILVCEEIEIKNVPYFGFVPQSSNNAYIKLSGFSRTAGSEIKNALLKLKSQKEIKSIVLDLRGNPGGLLDAAIDVAEKFIKKGSVVVTVKGKKVDKTITYKSSEKPVAGNIPLAVLINGGTASASEIVAGAIQDHDRGILIGTPSFGKGLVQTVVPLSYNTSLKLTTAKYFTPSGRSIQKVDYFFDNDVLVEEDSLKKQEFETDNKRKVFSAGGITPDSIVKNTLESDLIKTLLAKGLFFKFATNYFNTSKNLNLDSLNSDRLLNSFHKYLNKNKYDYQTKIEDLIEKLNTQVEKGNYSKKFAAKIDELSLEYKKLKKDELLKFKNEIVIEIRKELAARLGGRSSRIKESLKYDKQFDDAISILKDTNLYNSVLSLGE